MGNTNSNNSKSALRKTQSVPDTQKLSPDAPVLFNKEKSLSQQKLNQNYQKTGKANKPAGKKSKHQQEDVPQLPQTEAVFLPDFPLRGDLEELDYDVIDVIAKGAFGNVIKVQREDQKRFYAMKVLDKAQILQEGAIRQCKEEAAIQSMAGEHPFIVKAYEYWQSKRFLYIVLDYVPHGDMFTLWTFHGAFPEDLVRLYIAEISMVIDYLHNASVIYRDVKMENILFDPKGHIQLTDFGLAKWLHGGEQTRTVCGTLQYMAPEVLSVYPYGHSADWWSVGILMYTMLAGKYPVDGADTHTNMAQKVFECDYLLPSHISDSAQDVINRFLTKSPHKRLSNLDMIQDLHFFQDVFFPDLIDGKVNPISVVPEDFFPMTGESWAPHLLTAEEQSHFDQFDDSRVGVADHSGGVYPHHPLRHHASQYRPPSIAATLVEDHHEPYRKRSYSQPMQVLNKDFRKESFSHSQLGPALEVLRRQNEADLTYILPNDIESVNSTNLSQPPLNVADPYRKMSFHEDQQYAQNMITPPYARQQSDVTRPLEAEYSRQTSYGQQPQSSLNTQPMSSGSAIDSRRSSRSQDSTVYRPCSGSSDGDRTGQIGGPRALQSDGGQTAVTYSGINRRSYSGDPQFTTISNHSPTPPSSSMYFANGYTNAGGYKTVEAPPTVTLKSTSAINTPSPGYNQFDYPKQRSNLDPGPTVSIQNCQSTPSIKNSYMDVSSGRKSSSDQTFKTVDSPPVIKLPPSTPNPAAMPVSSQNNRDLYSENVNRFKTQNSTGSYDQDGNTFSSQYNTNSYNQDVNRFSIQNNGNSYNPDVNRHSTQNSTYNQDANRFSTQNNSSPYDQGLNRFSTQANQYGQELTNQPQMNAAVSNFSELPTSSETRLPNTNVQVNSQGQRYKPLPPVPQKPQVPQKPAVAQKPMIQAKPLAPVRPQPAPRKSVRSQPPTSGADNPPSAPVFNRGNGTFSNRPMNLSSYPTLAGGAADVSLSASYPTALPLALDPTQTFSGAAGYSGSQTPVNKSPNVEKDNFKWNLPADATPTYL